MLNISASVGLKGINKKDDVKLVQVLLNSYLGKKKLDDDGIAGKNTIREIISFQRKIMPGWKPDGRVDPKGRTFSSLLAFFNKKEQAKLSNSIKTRQKYCMLKAEPELSLNEYKVTYKHNIPNSKRIVSVNSMSVIKLALARSGMKHAVITSTLRTPQEQASIMYREASKNLKKQYKLYSWKGDKVLRVYEENKDKSRTDAIKLMVDEIDRLKDAGQGISRHVVSVEEYKKLNVIDIGVGSTRAMNDNFNKNEFSKRLKELAEEGYIEKYIDETNISNQCWHIEVRTDKKMKVKVI
ncbi:hypothetical protein INR79_16085 [Vibrio sp. SCSIO 43132]|uniref:peptidoglycan-binding domain-containing protein n=1 Tax=Vibrio TaxID=662 RepID=UPI001CA7C1DA|nr:MULTISPECIES: peptidoglycan-binding domain-containing protein [Vibrio]UAB70006.1 hypothetical protein INR79_16085 [Vibrio sp. SCSIO 43132]BDU35870.1 hypothetical protein TUMSATVNIG2_03390 [Vibrio nigripulchritudo]BDU41541.1 hypothetical protein TUMSATVNIG3_03390 [Vibrio nigripulchritudo]